MVIADVINRCIANLEYSYTSHCTEGT